MKVTRKIHGRIKNQDWSLERITNKEENLSMKHSDIGRYTKAQRVGWFGAYCKNG